MVCDCYISSLQEVPFINRNYWKSKNQNKNLLNLLKQKTLFYLLCILLFLCLISLAFPDTYLYIFPRVLNFSFSFICVSCWKLHETGFFKAQFEKNVTCSQELWLLMGVVILTMPAYIICLPHYQSCWFGFYPLFCILLICLCCFHFIPIF